MANNIGVILCGSCDRPADLIIDGLCVCSSHGLIVVLQQLERAGIPVSA